MNRAAVLGGGAWGTALALTLIRAGHAVGLWARDRDIVAALARGANPAYLPGIAFEAVIEASNDLALAVADADRVLVAVPAQSIADVLGAASPSIPQGVPVILCAKGLERASGRFLSQVAREILPGNEIAVLSGPSFAADVARGLPTAVVVAAESAELAASLAATFSSSAFRCYSTDDRIGVEIGGALKNVLAIAAGAVAGAGLGASAQAALVTRGFAELRRIGASFGARPETLMGLSGLGDLLLTCGSAQSRNFSYGVALGRGEALAGRPLAEGVATAAIAARIARERDVEAPIVDAVAALLDGRIAIGEAVGALMSRPLRAEAE